MMALLVGCTLPDADLASERKAQAENFFRGVYGCGPTMADELAGDDVVLSCPIFPRCTTPLRFEVETL